MPTAPAAITGEHVEEFVPDLLEWTRWLGRPRASGSALSGRWPSRSGRWVPTGRPRSRYAGERPLTERGALSRGDRLSGWHASLARASGVHVASAEDLPCPERPPWIRSCPQSAASARMSRQPLTIRARRPPRLGRASFEIMGPAFEARHRSARPVASRSQDDKVPPGSDGPSLRVAILPAPLPVVTPGRSRLKTVTTVMR